MIQEFFKDLTMLNNLDIKKNKFTSLHPDIFKPLGKFNISMDCHLLKESGDLCNAIYEYFCVQLYPHLTINDDCINGYHMNV